MSMAPVIRIRAKVPSWNPNERLRKIRRDEGLSMTDFAAKLGVKESTYAAWETGRNKVPDLLTLSETIEDVFGYSKYWVRGDLDNEFTPTPPSGGVSESTAKITDWLSRSGKVTGENIKAA